jgi:hypothetical protein
MPELKALPPGAVQGFHAAVVDLETIKYSDKVREKARIVRLVAKKEERAKELEQQTNSKHPQIGGFDTKAKQSAACAKAQRDNSDDSDADSDDGDSISSSSSGGSGSSGSSSGSHKVSKPNSAAKRMRKGRKKVRELP